MIGECKQAEDGTLTYTGTQTSDQSRKSLACSTWQAHKLASNIYPTNAIYEAHSCRLAGGAVRPGLQSVGLVLEQPFPPA